MSVVLVSLLLLLEAGPASPRFGTLLSALLPWALHHRHAVRIPAQVRVLFWPMRCCGSVFALLVLSRL